ncbi:hypothetical protein ACN28S_10120 [Cystobacter fuscus]
MRAPCVEPAGAVGRISSAPCIIRLSTGDTARSTTPATAVKAVMARKSSKSPSFSALPPMSPAR